MTSTSMRNKILRSALNVYEHNENDKTHGLKINSYMLIFQDLTINHSKDAIDENVMFLVVNMPKLDRKKDATESIQLFIKEIKRRKAMYLITIIPNTKLSSSLLVFMKKEFAVASAPLNSTPM